LLNAIAASALRILSAVDARSLSLIVWAVAKLVLGDEPLLTSIAAASLRLISQAGPQGLSNTVWAFAARKVLHAPLFEAISSAALNTIHEYGQQELGNTAWAFAELRVMNDPLMQAISEAAIRTVHNPCSDLEEASRGAYALAWAQGRLALDDHARTLIASHAAQGRCHSLALGLTILDEEWSRCVDGNGALSALEALTANPKRGLREDGPAC